MSDQEGEDPLSNHASPVSHDTSSTHDDDPEMRTTFASVFVKVEVDSDNHYETETESTGTAPKSGRGHIKRTQPTTVFNCEWCDYTTNIKHCLETHQHSHSNEKPFTCNECTYTSKYMTALRRHKKNKHNEERSYECSECNYKTNFKWNLKLHKSKHTEKKQYKCIHCDFESAYKQSFMKHNKAHHKGLTFFKCDKCPFQTKFEGHITRHLAKLHNEVFETGYKCNNCDFSTKYNWRLSIHDRRMKREQPIKCPLNCDFETQYNCAYKQHKNTHLSEYFKRPKQIMRVGTVEESLSILKTSLQPTLNYENVQINTSQELNIEDDSNYTQNQPIDTTYESLPKQPTVNSHSQANNYILDPHGIDWNRIDVLESNDGDKPFKCTKCRYTAKFKASVQRHFQRHHTGNQKTYKCTNCDFSTKTKDQISLHNKRSITELPMICNVCSFTTYFKCTSVMHQKTHYENKCKLCSYSCKHKHELQRHVESFHLGGGQKCRFCDYKSHRKESILCHETIHTGHKPFQCPMCEYSSVRRSVLDKHYKKYHCAQRPNDTIIINQEKIQSLRIIVPNVTTDSSLDVTNTNDVTDNL